MPDLAKLIKPGHDELLRDIYFQEDFVRLHARHGYDGIFSEQFVHSSGLVPIAGTGQFDLETPWGYGGPIARDNASLDTGICEWKQRQQASGIVAEFVRLHPLMKVSSLEQHFDMLCFNRPTAFVDLRKKSESRWKHYSDSTRNCIRKAERSLTVRRLGLQDSTCFQELYEAGLRRHTASENYFFSAQYYEGILENDWCITWAVFDGDEPVAVASFLQSITEVCHYHLSGGNDRSRETNAMYLLLEFAIDYFSKQGCRLLHLGGGHSVDPNDSLLMFKKKFSHFDGQFFIGGIVHDREKYVTFRGGQKQFLCSQ